MTRITKASSPQRETSPPSQNLRSSSSSTPRAASNSNELVKCVLVLHPNNSACGTSNEPLQTTVSKFENEPELSEIETLEVPKIPENLTIEPLVETDPKTDQIYSYGPRPKRKRTRMGSPTPYRCEIAEIPISDSDQEGTYTPSTRPGFKRVEKFLHPYPPRIHPYKRLDYILRNKSNNAGTPSNLAPHIAFYPPFISATQRTRELEELLATQGNDEAKLSRADMRKRVLARLRIAAAALEELDTEEFEKAGVDMPDEVIITIDGIIQEIEYTK